MTNRVSRVWATRVLTSMVGTALIAVTAAACGGSKSGPAAAPPVEDHVHGVVAGSSSGQLIAATHYGLETSSDGGEHWSANNSLGQEMVGGLVHTKSNLVAALQPMTGQADASGSTTTSGTSMSGMNMSASQMQANVAYSADGSTWRSSLGIPNDASIAAITSQGQHVWVSVLGKGVFASANAGKSFTDAIPDNEPISTLAVAGRNLLMATPGGIFVTATTGPSMPALAQLSAPINDIQTGAGCSTCVVAALGTGGIASSHNDGVTWKHQSSPATFDELYASGHDLFGMVPSASTKGTGIWRSTDGGSRWTHVLDQPLVDHMYAETTSHGSELLAFQWGIKVWRSTDGGSHWTSWSAIKRP